MKRVKKENGQYSETAQKGSVLPKPKNAQKGTITLQTLQIIDTSNVPEQHMPVIKTLARLNNTVHVRLRQLCATANSDAAKRVEIEENSQKMSALFAKLNSRDISADVVIKLVVICEALDRRNFSTVFDTLAYLSIRHEDECKEWVAALKRMVSTMVDTGLNMAMEGGNGYGGHGYEEISIMNNVPS